MTIRFDHTVPKVVNGQTVLSDTLYSGEKLETGESYNEVKQRLTDQGYTTGLEPDEVESATSDPRDGLTTDPTKTHTMGVADLPPSKDDSKQKWYDWAKSVRNLHEKYDDITKAQIIAKYGI